jgi:hypothetical protein
MPYVSYNNVKAYVSLGDGSYASTISIPNTLFATDFNASNTTQLKRVKRIGQELDYYIQTGPKSASISTTVIPITGVGLNQLTRFLSLTGDFTNGSYIRANSYTFQKCFLKSFGFSLEPWKPLAVEMQFDCYGLEDGVLDYVEAGTSESGIISPLRGMSVTISAPNFTQTINQYENLNFNVEVDRAPNFEIGGTYPAKVSVSKITKSLQINGISNIDWLSDYQPNTTVSVTVGMPDGNSFSVAGVLSSQSFSVDGNGVAKGGLQIVEEMV